MTPFRPVRQYVPSYTRDTKPFAVNATNLQRIKFVARWFHVHRREFQPIAATAAAAAAAAVMRAREENGDGGYIPAHSVVGFWNLTERPCPALHAALPGTWQGTMKRGMVRLWVVRLSLKFTSVGSIALVAGDGSGCVSSLS